MPSLHHSDHATIEIGQSSFECASVEENQDPCNRIEETTQLPLELIQECAVLFVLFVFLKTVLLDHLT